MTCLPDSGCCGDELSDLMTTTVAGGATATLSSTAGGSGDSMSRVSRGKRTDGEQKRAAREDTAAGGKSAGAAKPPAAVNVGRRRAAAAAADAAAAMRGALRQRAPRVPEAQKRKRFYVRRASAADIKKKAKKQPCDVGARLLVARNDRGRRRRGAAGR
ncbi:hypothetical protein FGB62_188g010 [Gracilaria domingensis]|nr:hypothetical protein FGB62_188g010 [Gracilaria domingensis]